MRWQTKYNHVLADEMANKVVPDEMADKKDSDEIETKQQFKMIW